jgi:hypothetical protein
LYYTPNDEPKPWVGLANPFTPQDHDIFAADAKITFGNEEGTH